MKAKLTGLGILLLVIVLAVAYTVLGKSRETTAISGYVLSYGLYQLTSGAQSSQP